MLHRRLSKSLSPIRNLQVVLVEKLRMQPEAGPSVPLPRKKPPSQPVKPFWWRLLGADTASEILSWRPGRKSALFLLVATTVSAAIAYDRSEAEKILREVEDRVRRYAEQEMRIDELPRKVMVYSSRLPDDGTEDRAVIWFKRWVKPILYAAGIEYQLLHGHSPGALARQLVQRFRERRLADLDKTTEKPAPGQLGYTKSIDESRELLDGGTVLVGRPAIKEYLWALKRGFLTDLDLDRAQRTMAVGSSEDSVFEEDLGQELAEDGFFDRALEDADTSQATEQPSETLSAGTYSSIASEASETQVPPTSARMLPALDRLPPQAPLLLIPFDHPLGSMLWWPKKAFNGLFNTRRHARLGAEMALRLVDNHTRPLEPPHGPLRAEDGVYVEEVEEAREWINEKRKLRRDVAEHWRANATGSRDLDTGLSGELYYDKAFRRWPANIAQARVVYEKELKPRIIKAHEEGGASESTLRAERLEREARWRRNLQGWRIVRPGSGVVWDNERMEGSLRVFTNHDNA